MRVAFLCDIYIHWLRAANCSNMDVSLKVAADEFILSGGFMQKSFVCKGRSVVNGKQFVKMGKTMRWLTFFTTGEGPQQSPLTDSKVLEYIKLQVRDHVQERLAELRAADDAPEEAAAEDLSERLGLASMGIDDDDDSEKEVIISKKSLNLLGKHIPVPLTIEGAPANWEPVFVIDMTLGTRMELSAWNLTNLFAAFEKERPLRAAVVRKKKLPVTPKKKAKASPKKKGTSPLPDYSPSSGKRRYDFKGVGPVRVTPVESESLPIGVRTPRKYEVVNRKRPAGVKSKNFTELSEKSTRTRRRRNQKMDTHSDQESDSEVFAHDEDPNLDSD